MAAVLSNCRTRCARLPLTEQGAAILISYNTQRAYFHVAEYAYVPENMLPGVSNVSLHVRTLHSYPSLSLRIDEQFKHRYIRTSHSLQTISQYFRRVLRCVVTLGADIIKPHHDYYDGVLHHRPNHAQYPLFQVRSSL
ncbi:Hypothetical predicted protein [Olea europaea subsp. europaea]|uniref:Uncharacterized protein n=1 Tax=Olea europaea subsp. europaea TaxID=158383 RepID=A0A8S0UAX3_OLEEU|nr:Hypothetical predicted protein [Olea europaea subsp. europaea]